jgi:hypothetical protein
MFSLLQQSSFDRAFVLKVFPLRFLNAFLILYYYLTVDRELARVASAMATSLVVGTLSSFGILHLLPAISKARAEKRLRRAAEVEVHRAASVRAAEVVAVATEHARTRVNVGAGESVSLVDSEPSLAALEPLSPRSRRPGSGPALGVPRSRSFLPVSSSAASCGPAAVTAKASAAETEAKYAPAAIPHAAVAPRAASALRRVGDAALSQAWVEAFWPAQDSYRSNATLIVQFGYVSIFSVAFPLAPLLFMLVNLISIRLGTSVLTCNHIFIRARALSFSRCIAFYACLGAWTLLRTARRPLARRASGLGVWVNVLQFTSLIGVITNAAILGFTSTQIDRWLPGLNGTEKVLAVLVYEHVLLLLRWAVGAAVPPVPRWVRKELEREQHELRLHRARVMGDDANAGDGLSLAAAQAAAASAAAGAVAKDRH